MILPETIDLMDSLTVPVQQFYNSVRPQQYEQQRRERFRSKFEYELQVLWKGCKLFTFGSSASGLYEAHSDIDFCLLLPDTVKDDEVTAIRYVAKFMHKKLRVHQFVTLLSARVPILKLHAIERWMWYKFDLCVNRPLGVHNSQLIGAYMELDSRARPLALLLKRWIKHAKLFNPSGGLSTTTFMRTLT
jgi:DNA polymerase sigma